MPRKSPRGKPYHKPQARDPNAPQPRNRGERSTPSGEHLPVMPVEVSAVLNLQPGHRVVDCTLGFGGHAVQLLERVGPTGLLLAVDRDAANLPIVEPKLAAIGFPFQLHHSNFAALPSLLAAAGIPGVDGLLADLGVSSMQLDDAERGFSFMRDGPLDMRMDPSRGPTAADLLHTLSEGELAAAFRDFGDEPAAEAVAAEVVKQRAAQPLTRTRELRELVERAAPVFVRRGPDQLSERKQLLLPATRVFQALRVLVNRELANLSQLLRVLPNVLNPGGVAVLISFQSGEDRLIKAAFRDGMRTGVYSAIAEEAIRPTEEEKRGNPRARSAKLRWARN